MGVKVRVVLPLDHIHGSLAYMPHTPHTGGDGL